MSKWLGLLMFVFIFAAICLGGYYYILARLFSFFKFKQNIWFWLLLVFLAFGYIGFSILDRKLPLPIWEPLLRVSALALGIGWVCLIVLLCHDILHLVFRFPIPISRWFAVGTIAVLTLVAIVNTVWIQIKSIDLPAPVNLRIVQLSDVHFGSVTQRHLSRLIQKTNALKPDLVLITGDFLDEPDSLSAQALAPLNQLTAPSYWISGNHERYIGLTRVMEALKTTPLIPLRNKAVDVAGIQLLGIDDSENHTQVQRILPTLSVDPDKYTILMYHRPDGFDAAANAGVNLMLTGHTHNGQIWPFNRVVKTRFKYIKGLHRIGDMTLWITTGSGTWGPPMRLGSRNQITVINLQKNN
jgi:uncharacterized protein